MHGAAGLFALRQISAIYKPLTILPVLRLPALPIRRNLFAQAE
jgi:hypothetical protein